MQATLNSAASYTMPKKATQQLDQEEGELRVQDAKEQEILLETAHLEV